jgi:hypothetical protein
MASGKPVRPCPKHFVGQALDAGDENILQSAVLEFSQHREPELREPLMYSIPQLRMVLKSAKLPFQWILGAGDKNSANEFF